MHPVFVKTALPYSQLKERGLVKWRLAALSKADGIRRVERSRPSGSKKVHVTAGPFFLRRGGVQGTPLPLFTESATALSEVAASLLWCFACLAAPLNADKKVSISPKYGEGWACRSLTSSSDP